MGWELGDRRENPEARQAFSGENSGEAWAAGGREGALRSRERHPGTRRDRRSLGERGGLWDWGGAEGKLVCRVMAGAGRGPVWRAGGGAGLRATRRRGLWEGSQGPQSHELPLVS